MPASAINVIISYLLDGLETLTPETYPNQAIKRWQAPIPFDEIKENINIRAIQLVIEDGGNGSTPGYLHGNNALRMREDLVLRVLYGFEVTEVLNDDKQGIRSIIMEDYTMFRIFFMKPNLFGALSGYTIDRPVYKNFNLSINKAGKFYQLELRYDFRWKQAA